LGGRNYDLVGKVFNELTVIGFHSLKRNGRNNEKYWLCNCSCGNREVLASTRELRKGRKKSCGHLNVVRRKHQHKYEIKDTYVVVYTHKDEPFYIDIEDLEIVLKRTWFKHHGGYICSKINNKHVRLHRYLLNPPEDKVVDHKNRITYDNRRSNLRICEPIENSWNASLGKNNTSGTTGVWFDKASGKWIAHIRCKGEKMYLGLFANKEDAIETRIKAEIKYFGEFQSKKEEDLPLPIINEFDFELNLHNGELSH
jgi:hypothetical protein